MNVEWKLFADLREYAGDARVTVEVDEGATVRDALAALVAGNAELEERVFDDDGSVRDHVNVVRNGENVETAGGGLDTEVTTRDELALFPPVSGGAA